MLAVKDDFLHALERVQPGLAVIEGVEQGQSFVFKSGHVHAFNKKLYASAPCPCPVEGAVRAKPLLAALRKLVTDEIEMEGEGDKLVFRHGKGWRNRFGMVLDDKIVLPFGDVDEPEKWGKLHESFGDALALVQETAGSDRTKYVCMCVHVHPEYLEAFDGLQGTCYEIPTGVRRGCLVERDVLKHVVASGVDEIGETDQWLHFKGGDIRMSCLRMLEDYPDISGAFRRTKGSHRVWLPASLQEAAEVPEVFSSEEKDANMLLVEIKDGEMSLAGRGASGFADAFPPCKYEGPPVKFYLSPALLKGLAAKSDSAYVTPEGRLVIDGGKWRYFTCVTKVVEKEA